MKRRFLTVALGFALTALVTPANARPSDIPSNGTWPNFSERTERSSESDHRRRRSAGQSRRRYGTLRKGRRQAARPPSRGDLASRSVTRFSGGSGTSRGCLRPTARALLGRIEAKFGQVRIISTCRPGATIAGSGRPSKHGSGEAIDFNAPSGHKGEIVRWLIANHKSGGTMTYAGMSHIHVDVGYHFVSLNSGGGR
jgi:hypothetical protein